MDERGKVKTEQDHCEPVCLEKLPLTLCSCEQYSELRHQAKALYNLMDNFAVLPAGMIQDDERTRIMSRLCSLTRQVRIDGRRVKGLPK